MTDTDVFFLDSEFWMGLALKIPVCVQGPQSISQLSLPWALSHPLLQCCLVRSPSGQAKLATSRRSMALLGKASTTSFSSFPSPSGRGEPYLLKRPNVSCDSLSKDLYPGGIFIHRPSHKYQQ